MGDGCIDNRQRTLINFLVYCLEGISFVKSVDALNIVKDLTNLFLLFDEVIEWMGPLDVVHIVTDNATNMWPRGDGFLISINTSIGHFMQLIVLI